MQLIIFNIILGLSLNSVHSLYSLMNTDCQSFFSKKALTITEYNYTQQPLNHFDVSDSRTWLQLYFKYDQHYKQGGAIVIVMSGETNLCPHISPFIQTVAIKANAIVYAIEHRYYGAQKPSDDIQYLNSKQALADTANFIKQLKLQEQFQNSKVITIGGSYSGSLSAWMRSKYPELVDAAIASSAPLLAKVDFYEYKDKVTEVFEKYGPPGCANSLRDYYKELKYNLSTPEGNEYIKRKFNICKNSDLTNKFNQQLLASFCYARKDANTVQYGTPERIKKYCKNITDDTALFGDDCLANLYAEGIIRYDYTHECYSVDIETTNEGLKSLERRFWIYQICTEFGFFFGSSNDSLYNSLFTLDFYYAQCEQIFGLNKNKVDAAVKATNVYYGGLKPNVTKVVFFNGGIDPWSTVGLKHDLSDGVPVNVVPGVAHCADLVLGYSSQAPKELQKVVEFEVNLILKWIQ